MLGFNSIKDLIIKHSIIIPICMSIIVCVILGSVLIYSMDKILKECYDSLQKTQCVCNTIKE